MAIFSGTVTTFASAPGIAGLREDLTEVIYNLSPTETPFMSNIARGKCSATFHEWQTHSLAAAAANAQFQGDDLTATDAGTVTVRLGNRTQIVRKSVTVDETARVVDKAGRQDELAFQVATKMKELKRDIEFVLLQNTARVTGGSGTAPKLASVLSWLITNISKAAGDGSNPTGDGSDARTDGTQRAFTEDMLQSVLQSIFENASDEPDVLMVPPAQKIIASGFMGNAQKTLEVANKKLVTAIDIYVGDFSGVTIVPNRFMRTRDALVLRHDLWKLCWLRPIKTVELAKTGDAEKRMIIGELTLEACNEKGSAGIFDIGG
jgi:hypothetical protein